MPHTRALNHCTGIFTVPLRIPVRPTGLKCMADAETAPLPHLRHETVLAAAYSGSTMNNSLTTKGDEHERHG